MLPSILCSLSNSSCFQTSTAVSALRINNHFPKEPQVEAAPVVSPAFAQDSHSLDVSFSSFVTILSAFASQGLCIHCAFCSLLCPTASASMLPHLCSLKLSLFTIINTIDSLLLFQVFMRGTGPSLLLIYESLLPGTIQNCWLDKISLS